MQFNFLYDCGPEVSDLPLYLIAQGQAQLCCHLVTATHAVKAGLMRQLFCAQNGNFASGPDLI